MLASASLAGALAKPGTELPDISLPDPAGNPHALKDLTKGKVAVLVYWSLTCPHCRQEMPDLIKLSRQLDGNPFVMLMINDDGPAMAPAAAAYAKDLGLPEPTLLDQGEGDGSPLGQALDIVGTPTVLVFTPGGKLVHSQEATLDLAKLKSAVQNAF